MFWKFCRWNVLPVVFVATLACNRPFSSTEVQESRMEATRNREQAHFTYMADNAIAQDMSIADIHFVGHTVELSGVGVNRLDRMAQFLNTYGGTVRYETFRVEDELIKQRLDHVREYLAMINCDMSRVEVATGISGGRGMPAYTAIEIDDRGTKAAAGAGDQITEVMGGS